MSDEVVVFHNPVFDRIPGDKKEKVIAAAVDEFADNGFAGANINRIAERSGISIGSLYKYFPAKENLYLSVVNLCFMQLEAELTPVLETDTPLADKIRSILDLLFDNAGRYRSLNRLYNRFTSEKNIDLARTIAVRVESITAKAYAGLLAGAKAQGLISEEIDERVFAFLTDNIFITLQFSLSCDYYEDRMKIFLGDDIAARRDYLRDQILQFICRALGLANGGITK